MKDYINTINIDLTPLEAVFVANELEQLREDLEATKRLRPLNAIEDRQLTVFDKVLNLVETQSHKIDHNKIRLEVTNHAKQYEEEQRTDQARNN